MYIRHVYTEVAMAKEYRAKTFKSGNSVALRLPKGLGVTEGIEMILREENGKFTAEPVDSPKRKIDISKFAGTCPWLTPLTPEQREFDDSPRAWDDPAWSGWPDKGA
jgi:antitoxin VapB